MYSKAIFLVLIAFPAQLFASVHAGHQPSFADTIPFWQNFLIFSGIMFLILRKPILSGWASRRMSIENAVLGAKDELKAAEAAFEAAHLRLSNLSAEIQQLTNEVEADIVSESKQIKDLATSTAEKIRHRAKETIQMEEKAAISRIRKDIAETALRVAQDKLKTFVTPDKDRKLRDLSLQRVRGLVN